MKLQRLYLVIALFSILTLASCNNKDKVKLVQTNITEEVPTLISFSFTFDKELAPDSLLYYWDTTEYVDFEPEIPGKFKWQSPTELIFSPAYELPAATDYTATLTNELVKYSKLTLAGDKEIDFHTPYLQLSNVLAYWVMGGADGQSATVQMDLNFNSKVNPTEVANLLNVEVEGEKQDVKMITAEPASLLTLQLPGIPMKDEDLKAEVSIAKGLKPYNGTNVSDDELDLKTEIPSPYKLEIQAIESDHNGMSGTVTIMTSQRVKEKDLDKFIEIDPEITFKTTITDEGIEINSESFDAKNKYTITLKAGLMGEIGGKLKSDYSEDVTFGELEPEIEILNSKGMYLSGQGERNLAVKIINVKKVKVTISKIYENNLMAAMNYGYQPEGGYDDYDYYYDDYYYDSWYYYDQTFGDVIYQEEFETSSFPAKGNMRLFEMDFADKLPEFNGIYHIKISSDEDYWLRDSRFVSISDIGLIAKAGKDNVHVFANSIKTAQPLSNVNIKLIGRNNQVVGTATTDGKGVAVVPLKNLNMSGFMPSMVIASVASDFNYLPLPRTRINTSRFDVGGAHENASGFDTYIYSERDIYRPGESLHLSAIIRGYEWNLPGQIPVKARLLLPNGKEYKTIKKTLNNQGGFEVEIETSPETVTGSYTFEVFTSNDVLLGSKRILVEEFMPDRIRVTTTLNGEEVGPEESIELGINAVNFFGPPAAGRNYEVDIQVKRRYFYSEDYPRYSFSISNAETYYDGEFYEGKTDDDGNAEVSFEVPEYWKYSGLLQADIFTTVFDETGRPVNKKDVVDIYTQGVFYGIGYFRYYNTTNSKVEIPLIAVNKEGKALNGQQARVELIKYEYKTVLEKSGSMYRYTSEKQEKLLDTKEMTLSGSTTTYSFVPTQSGSYEIRIYPPGVNTYVKRNFYCYGYGYTYNSSFEVDNEGNVDIELDKENYIVGENANLLFKTPFSGKMLVTVEGQNVIDHFYVETDKQAASVSLKLSQEYVPNAYVTATLIKPHTESDMPLTVAHGFVPIMVEDPASKMPVEITAVEKSRSKSKQTIKVKAFPNAKVTIAVVDEGILQVTGFQTPDPHGFFYRKRALEVSSHNIYPHLFPEYAAAMSSTGGDGYDLAKRVNPMQNKRVKLVSFWSGILQANSKGEVTYEIDIPQFSGDVRIMAVAYQDNAFGSAQANMKVADPIVISSSVPRFLAPGDTAVIPVTMSNTTSGKANGKASISVSGPLKAVGNTKQSLNIDANREGQLTFKVYAEKEIGEGQIVVTMDALNEKFTEETDITVRPASPLLKMSGSGVVDGGKTARPDIKIGDFIASSVDYKLVISKSPMVQFTDDLDYLVRYPYGCTEQTISAAFPQLYFADMAKLLLKQDKSMDPNPNYHIQEAIRKIMLRQLYNGALTMWTGGGYENWWVTAYGAHFLIEAKKAGFEVDQSVLDYMYSYLITRLKDKNTTTYYYNGSLNKQIAPREVAYSLYVLALAGKPQTSTMNYYKSNQDMLTLDSKYLLAAAYYLSGDRTKYKDILPNAFEGEIGKQQFGGSFSSPIRDEAIALNALIEIDPDHPQIGTMTLHLTEKLKNTKYLNTQERVFAFLALGKIAKMANSTNMAAEVRSGGKTVGNYTDGMLQLTTGQLNTSDIEISTSGSGKLYYFWESEGISKTGEYLEEDNYLKVRRSFYDRDGNPINGGVFKQNDLVVVKISVQGSQYTDIDNVVISDILPACFEIENPRLDAIPGMDWIKGRSYPDHQDIRDDRINLFDDITKYTYDYYYVVRAVSLGTYHMGPVGADAMYNGEYHSYHGARIIKVVPKD